MRIEEFTTQVVMLNITEASAGCAEVASNESTDPICADTAGQLPDWPGTLQRQEVSRVVGGSVVCIIVILFSAPPAAVIWRTPSLHRVSYLYVMVLSLLDCLVGVVSLIMAVSPIPFSSLIGGVPCWFCVLFEALTNGCMNAVNVVMLALGRDRYLSLAHALSYPLLATANDVKRHVKMAAAYGGLHAAIFIGARAYYGCVNGVQNSCLPLNWLLRPEYRVVAVVTVFSNIFLDGGTIAYNGCVMYWAWKVRQASGRMKQ